MTKEEEKIVNAYYDAKYYLYVLGEYIRKFLLKDPDEWDPDDEIFTR